MDPKNPHKRIWLLDDYWDGDPCYLWCEDPAPGLDQDPDDAIGPYIHADDLRKLAKEMKKTPEMSSEHWAEKIENLIRGK